MRFAFFCLREPSRPCGPGGRQVEKHLLPVFCFGSALLVFVLFSFSFSQNALTGYHSPEEVASDLSAGILDTTEAKHLFDLFEKPVQLHGRDLERLLAVPGILPSDIDTLAKLCRQGRDISGLPKFPLIESFVESPGHAFFSAKMYPGWARQKDFYKKGLCRLQWDRWSLRTEILDDTLGYGFYRRSLAYDGKNMQAVLGNFEPFLGLGLVCGGGYPERPHAQRIYAMQSFTMPSVSMPDGGMAEWSAHHLYLGGYGMRIPLHSRGLQIGGVAFGGQLHSMDAGFQVQAIPSENLSNAGFYAKWQMQNLRLSGEAAFSSSGQNAWIMGLDARGPLQWRYRIFSYTEKMILPVGQNFQNGSAQAWILESADTLLLFNGNAQGAQVFCESKMWDAQGLAFQKPDQSDPYLEARVRSTWNMPFALKGSAECRMHWRENEVDGRHLALTFQRKYSRIEAQSGGYLKREDLRVSGYSLWVLGSFEVFRQTNFWFKPFYRKSGDDPGDWWIAVGEKMFLGNKASLSANWHVPLEEENAGWMMLAVLMEI